MINILIYVEGVGEKSGKFLRTTSFNILQFNLILLWPKHKEVKVILWKFPYCLI